MKLVGRPSWTLALLFLALATVMPALASAEKPAPKPEPKTRESTEVRKGIAAIKPAAEACGAKTGKHGVVRVYFVIEPDGHVIDAMAKEAPDWSLANCVVDVVKGAKFEALDVDATPVTFPFRIP